jgi:hypothetical protein
MPIVIVPDIERPIRMASMLARVRKKGDTKLMRMPATSRTSTRADSRWETRPSARSRSDGCVVSKTLISDA